MKTNVLSIALAAGLFLIAGCQKTDEVAPKDSFGNKGARLSATTTTQCDVISFTGASGLITSVTSQNGLAVEVESHNPHFAGQPEAAMIFNSAAPFYLDGEDLDLGSPNAFYGGPGMPSLASSNNTTSLGNIIVLQNFNAPYGSTTPNDFDVSLPGAYIEFIFPQPVHVQSIKAIDVEAAEGEHAEVVLYDGGNAVINTVNILSTSPNGVSTTDLTASGVKRMVIQIVGSMGFDDLQFCVPTNACSYTQGYWKTHGPDPKGNNVNEWPVTSLILGTVNYSDAQLLSIMKTPVGDGPKGNGLISLAHQLIAAKLNIANGSSSSAIQSTITQADALIGALVVPPVGSGYLAPSAVSSLVDTLTKYNEGTLTGGPTHCD